MVGFGLACIFWYRYGEEVINMVDEAIRGITNEQRLKEIFSIRKEVIRSILFTRFKLKKEDFNLGEKPTFENLRLHIVGELFVSSNLQFLQVFYAKQELFEDIYSEIVEREKIWIFINKRVPTDVELIEIFGFKVNDFFNVIKVE